MRQFFYFRRKIIKNLDSKIVYPSLILVKLDSGKGRNFACY